MGVRRHSFRKRVGVKMYIRRWGSSGIVEGVVPVRGRGGM